MLWKKVQSLFLTHVFSTIDSALKNLPANARHAGLIPGRKEWQPAPVFLPGKSMGRGAWQATVHGVAKSQTQLND